MKTTKELISSGISKVDYSLSQVKIFLKPDPDSLITDPLHPEYKKSTTRFVDFNTVEDENTLISIRKIRGVINNEVVFSITNLRKASIKVIHPALERLSVVVLDQNRNPTPFTHTNTLNLDYNNPQDFSIKIKDWDKIDYVDIYLSPLSFYLAEKVRFRVRHNPQSDHKE
jgi:hypothetical protein